VPDFSRVSDVMLYDIARDTATVLQSIQLNRQRAAANEAEREYWVARGWLVRQQIKALSVDDRAGMIAQEGAWDDEARGLRTKG